MDESTIFLNSSVPKNEGKNGDSLIPVSKFSPFINKFLEEREKVLKIFHQGGDTIRVSEILGSIAHLYERIRNVVEYKGEHVLRRNAIERILRRLLWEHAGRDTQKIAQVLLRELIWARYLPNDEVPRSKGQNIAKIIDKYLYFLDRLANKNSGSALSKHRSWIWGIASCEIEEAVDPSNRDAYINLMYSWFTTYYRWKDAKVTDNDKEIQIYLAIHRALAKSDDEIMRYHLLIKIYPNWVSADKTVVDDVVGKFYSIHEAIEKYLHYPDRFKLYRIVQRQIAPFEIFKTLVSQEKNQIRKTIDDQIQFELKIHEICRVKYSQIKQKINRGILRSIIYIFITKVALALLIEIPYEIYKFGHLNYIPIGINIIVPPTMMWLVGLTIRPPTESNTLRILTKLNSVVYFNPNPSITDFSLIHIKQESLLTNIFALIYLLLFILVFGGLTYLLMLAHFDIVGVVIFFAFLSLVLLFGFRVRYTSSELKITSDKESFIGYIFNNLTMPLLSTGVYLSKGLAKINFISVILDFLIEAPLKTIIQVIEEWTSFMREKREEVVELPEQ
ncbi:MAG: hypothetical protein UR52_C0023G0005 [Candidatus Gottesmanbacteria bacterium GW2011_GWA1_34_13]|uniref:Uncharacterized protein n=1 Tax=Candidatus Gottesmanbacteria bacterium GW2011_GWA1_34_13 TaxID=1618434 RepID=A0A0G0B2P4_9BACT|nr:MAG: hypothetical protein UR52_C0023G0005 [Candidatus Gottesmanbacteria bacterium GW2011_GWA1_34_13]